MYAEFLGELVDGSTLPVPAAELACLVSGQSALVLQRRSPPRASSVFSLHAERRIENPLEVMFRE